MSRDFTSAARAAGGRGRACVRGACTQSRPRAPCRPASPPSVPRNQLARSQLILSRSLSALPTLAPPSRAAPSTAMRLGLPCAGDPGDVGLRGGPRCEQTGWASFPALLSPAEAPAKRPTRLWFSSIRQGKQRQRPTRHRAQPTSTSATGTIIGAVGKHTATRDKSVRKKPESPSGVTKGAPELRRSRARGTLRPRRCGRAGEAPTDHRWTAGQAGPHGQPPHSGS